MSFFFTQKDIEIEIITTNDIHGAIPPQKAWFINPSFPPDIIGGSGMIKYLEENRATENSEFLIFDAGNFFQGHPYGMINGGSEVIKWMNQIGYTALVPGENDFVLGQANLNKLANQSNFPFLMTNLICNDCDLKSKNIKPYIIKEINGVKIGVLGIVNSAIKDLALSINIQGLDFENAAKSLEKWIPILKAKDVNSIIVLTSSGVPYDRDEKYDDFVKKISQKSIDPYLTDLNSIELGRFAEGVDIIISGGISKGYKLPWYDPYSHVYIFQNYGDCTEFGHFKANFDFETKIFKGYSTVIDGEIGQSLFLDDFDPDYNSLDDIKIKNKEALNTLYDFFDIKKTEKNQFSDINQRKIDLDQWNIPEIGSDSNLDVITWNCEFFPAAGDSTINAMAEIINDINVDIIAFQEIRKIAWFDKLMTMLPDYDYIISQNSSFLNQAFIFKKDHFSFIRQREPFSDEDYNFARRPPLRLDLLTTYKNLNIPISLLNLHMKCCDSGLQRRKKASQMLYNYIENEIDEYSYSNFIVLGDWNDDLKDSSDEHCFNPFLNDEKYNFLSDLIDDDLNNASYPKEPYVSFLDHIMTTSEFVDYKNNNLIVKTVMIEDYIGGYEVYDNIISDHRPVMFSIPFDSIKNQ